jgi:hypothetical protein
MACRIPGLRRLPVLVAAGLAFGMASCAAPPPPPKTAVQTSPRPHAPPAPPDWFHRELSLARHARLAHLPHSDTAGARQAYNAVMVPACRHVEQAGPDKYRARCTGLIQHATAAAPPARDDFSCNDDHDDSHDDVASIAACSD